MNKPWGVAVDASGNVYIADTFNHRIRRIDAEGIISTIAGTGVKGFSGDGGHATEAALDTPEALAVDVAGSVFIADRANRRIRRVSPQGVITTVAGGGGSDGDEEGGLGTAVELGWPGSLAIGVDGSLFIADLRRVFRLDTEGMISTFVGRGRREPDYPSDVTVAANRTVYVADTRNHRILAVEDSGRSSIFAGTGEPGFSGDGGPASIAELYNPQGVAVDLSGNVYIADTLNDRIRLVETDGIIKTLAGTGERGFGGDGELATRARFAQPSDVAIDSIGRIYVADSHNHRIRMIDTAGRVATIAGTGEKGDSGDGGPATQARLIWPQAVALDSIGRVYIACGTDDRIRMIDEAGMINTVAGTGQFGYSGDGGPASVARLWRPSGIAVGIDGSIFIGDTGNQLVRRMDTRGIITTIAGNRRRGYDGEGAPATGFRLANPTQLAVDPHGTVFIVDSRNHRIRRLRPESPTPVVTSVVNGASFSQGLAPDAFAVLTGTELAPSQAAAPTPSPAALPTTLLGTSLVIADSNGDRHNAGLHLVSSTEIRFQVPEVAAVGPAGLVVRRGAMESEGHAVDVMAVAPGLFSANGDGRGVAAASAFRVARDGTVTPLDASLYDSSLERNVPLPLDLGLMSDRLYLRLYGTGMRGASGATLATIRGRYVLVQSSRPSLRAHGVDEVVIGPVPRALSGRESEVVVIVDGRKSNPVTIALK